MDSDKMLLEFLLNLFITFDIYTLPIIIWRYVIKKQPVEKSKATEITIIYGIIAWIAMSILLYILAERVAGGSILFWSFINYIILISKNRDKSEPKPTGPQPTEDPEVTRARIEKLADELYVQYIGRSDADLKMIIKSNTSEAAEMAAKRVLEQRKAQRQPYENEGDENENKEPQKSSKKTSKKLLPYILVAAIAVVGTWIIADNKIEKNYDLGYDDGYDYGYEHGQDIGYANGYYDGTADERAKHEDLINFVDKHVVFCTDQGKKYHKFYCSHIQTHRGSFYAFNVEYAEYRGYQPCSDCFA